MKGYFTTDTTKEFCDRYFEVGKQYHIIKETEGYILVKAFGDEKEQMMTKLWLEKGMFNFLTFHEEE